MGLFKKALIAGSLIGVGMLLAPKDGKSLRSDLREHYDAKLAPIIKDLNKKAADLYKQTKDIDSDEIKANLRKKISDVQDAIKNLDAKSAGKATVDGIKKASSTLAHVAKDVATSPKTKAAAKKVTKVAADVADKAAQTASHGAKKVKVLASKKKQEELDLENADTVEANTETE